MPLAVDRDSLIDCGEVPTRTVGGATGLGTPGWQAALATMLVTLSVAACYGGPAAEQTTAPPVVPTASSGGLAEVSPSPSATARPTPSEQPTNEPPTAPPTQPPTPPPTKPPVVVTPAPTPPPTKPPATPIPWDSDGPEGSIDVPFAIYAGTTITFRIWSMPAPATCTLTFKWPDATSTALGAKTATYVGPSAGSTNAYAASWNLEIPASQVGDGTFTYVCTYLGVERINSSFWIPIRPPQ
jgi:hypothetical protein